MHFLMGADQDHFGSAIEDFQCAYLMDRRSSYPKTLHDAYTLLKGWKKTSGGRYQPTMMGVSFNTVGTREADGDALINQGTKKACTRCGRTNHTIDKCIAKRHEDGTLLHTEGGATGGDEVSPAHAYGSLGDNATALMFVNSDTNSTHHPKSSSNGAIPSSWILLDSQSTIDVFSNGELLEKI